MIPPSRRKPATDLEATAAATERLRWLHRVNGRLIRTSFPEYAAAAALLLAIPVEAIESLMRLGWYSRTDTGWWFDG
jgi:hypothetical protein